MDLFCSKKRWFIPEYESEKILRLCNELKISHILSEILVKRGIENPSDARWFLNTEDLYLYDPFLLCDMDKAVERIGKAMEMREKICVYGDYDVDGITATAVMFSYFKSKNCDCIYYIPQRLTEGYGMNMAAVDRIAAEGVKLIVTVDNGITANAEIEYARNTYGIDVVVTDHHECRGELPECCAVINPKRPDNTYPFDGLAGVGVAFKTVCALEGSNVTDAFIDEYSVLASLGTIADVMPLMDENRQLVARGLSCISKGNNKGINMLMDLALSEKNRGREKKVSASTVGFLIAPRLNAAGRIGRVEDAVELLCAKEYSECNGISRELCEKNRERQQIENRIYSEAVKIIENTHNFEDDRIIVACSENWHHGVVGIVASRITEKYGLPSILICLEGDTGKGSARSIKGFNINEAIHTCSDVLVRHGGHELAAGLTINPDNIDLFRERINEFARDRITDDILCGFVEIDAELSGNDINLETCDELALLEPFGTSNTTPLLYIRDAAVKDVISLGQNKHTKLILEKDGKIFEALLFGFPGESFSVPPSGCIDVLFNLDVNEFRGERTPQLIVRDLRLCRADAEKCAFMTEVMHSILSGERKELVPEIETCRSVYRYLKTNSAKLEGNVNLYILANEMSAATGMKIHCPVLGVILEIFSEMGLAVLTKTDDMIMRIDIVKNCGKVDIEASKVLMKAKNIQ